MAVITVVGMALGRDPRPEEDLRLVDEAHM
jgi:hypothetical protein